MEILNLEKELKKRLGLDILDGSSIYQNEISILINTKSKNNKLIQTSEDGYVIDTDQNINLITTVLKSLGVKKIDLKIENSKINSLSFEKQLNKKMLKTIEEAHLEDILPAYSVSKIEKKSDIIFKIKLVNLMCFEEDEVPQREGFQVHYEDSLGGYGLLDTDKNIKAILNTLKDNNYELIDIKFNDYDHLRMINEIIVKKIN